MVAEGEGTATIKAVIPEVFGKTLKCKVTVKENEGNQPDTDNSVENNVPNNNTQKPIDDNANMNQGKDESENDSSSIHPPHISISGGNINSGSNSSGNGSSTTVVTNTNVISIVEREIITFGSTKSYDISISGTNDIGTVTWSSSNEKVLKVDQDGKAHGICPGTATLKATTSKGLTSSINIDIVKVEGNSFIDIPEKLDIKERLDDTYIKNIQWKSENETIASIDKNGIVTGLKEGTTKIIGTVDNITCVEITCKVYDNSYISINNPGTLTVGEKATLSTYSSGIPSDAVIKWGSSNPSVLSVNDKGEAKALSAGESTVSVYLNEKMMDTITITVQEKEPEEPYFHIADPGTLMVGDTKTLTASSTNVPDNATIRWKSSNTEVLTITDAGEAKALFPSEVEVAVYVNDIYMDSITIKIEGDVEAELIYNAQKTVVIGCSNKERATKITIPNGVTTIGVSAFYGMNNAKTVTMPDSVIEIDNNAFSGCGSLIDIMLSKNIKRIGENAFSGCDIENIDLPETLGEIGDYCFSSCDSITSIKIPDKVTIIPQDCFNSCDNLETVILPKNIKRIESWAFYGCRKLKSIDISGVTYIGSSAFRDCTSLEKIAIPDTIISKYVDYGLGYDESSIGEYAFSNCSNLKEVTLSKNMQYIPEHLFANCSAITEIILPENTKKIARSAFQSCASLEKVTIPATVTSIDDTAFQYCYSLSAVCGEAGSYAETWAKEKDMHLKR